MNLLNGKKELLKILSYHLTEDFSGVPTVFEVDFNPEELQKKLSVCYHDRQAPGDNTKELSYSRTNTGDVTLNLFFDETTGSSNPLGLAARIELFHRLTSQRNPQTHKNHQLTLVWGTFIFNCKLKSADVKYTLFKPNGIPLRATITATFEGHEPRARIAALEKLFSADLTHVHLVKAGESLPLIAKRIYGDPAYYMEIARVNNLKNFRNLRPAQKLILPPLDKTEEN